MNSIGFKNIVIVDSISQNKYKEKNLVNLEYEHIIDKTTFLNNLDDYSNSEFCFHQGACSDTTNSDYTYMKENNLEYSIKLFDFVIKTILTWFTHLALLYMEIPYHFLNL